MNENSILFLLMPLLVISSVSDLWSRKIPNLVTYPAMIGGIIYHTVMGGYQGSLFSLAGIGAGIGLLLITYIAGGTGAGDVKLMGAVGGLLGPQGALMGFVFTCIVGGIHAVAVLAWKGYLKSTFKRYGTILKTFLYTRELVYIPPPGKEKLLKINYGVSIAVGTLLYVFVYAP